jgi:multidrug efflux system outer membrane protein
MTRKLVTCLLLSCTVLSASCTMIPDYMRPDFAASDKWSDVPGYNLPPGDVKAADTSWEAFFQSPQLRQVIDVALQNNTDLRQAALNIEAARATYRISRADLLPSINANGSGTYVGLSDDQMGGGSNEGGNDDSEETYQANVGLLTYELDLFGRIRSNNRSALNEYLATEQAHAVLRNTLIAEVANAYLQLLADQKLLGLTEQTLEAQEKTHNLLQQSLEKGVGTAQDVARASTAVETARVNLHQYRRFVAQDQNALFLLMGVKQDNAALPLGTLDSIAIRGNLDAGMPSQVLLNRPDVKQAEYLLLARNADIGAARAAFFPNITLTGTYGFASDGLSGLFSSGATNAWTFLPQITMPIFAGGRNRANLDLSEVRKEIAVVEYEQTVQIAFREVADELAARATLDEQLKAQERLVAAAQQVYDMSRARYDVGIDSFLSVLDSQRELYTAQQNEIEIERQKLANLVNLYKALGGGAK